MRPRLIKAVDPVHLIDEVKKAIQHGEDMVTPTFVSNDGLLCLWVAPIRSLYEYRLITADNLETLEMQVANLSELHFDFLFNTTNWNSMYLQWMQRMTGSGLAVREVVKKVAQEDLIFASRADELQLVEDVRSYLHLAPMGDNAQLVTIPFPLVSYVSG